MAQHAILCDSCVLWSHISCNKLTYDDYLLHVNLPDRPFCCDACLLSILPFNHLDPTDFNDALFSLKTDSRLNLSSVMNLNINPLIFNQDFHHLGPLNDIDPDNLYLSGTNIRVDMVSKYYLEDQLAPPNTPNNLSVLNYNVRSINNKIDDLHDFLFRLPIKFDIVMLTETWLRNSDSQNPLESINEYTPYIKNRPNQAGGGVAILVRKSLNQFVSLEPSKNHRNLTFESIFIDLKIPNQKPLMIGCIYKPPHSSITDYNREITKKVSQLKPHNNNLLIGGDFNIDLLKADTHEPTKQNIDTMLSLGLIPRISSPTRITPHSATNIDNIYSNNIINPISSGIIINDISDHLPNFIILNSEVSRNITKPIKIRNFCARNIERFINNLNTTDWSPYLNCSSPHKLNDLIGNLTTKINAHFPLKARSVTKLPNKPWITVGIRNSTRRKNVLYSKMLALMRKITHSTSSSPVHDNDLANITETYKKYKNLLTSITRKSKAIYYQNELSKCRTNMKKTWNIINEIIHRQKRTQSPPSYILDNGTIICDKKNIANKFNETYTKLGSNLAAIIANSNHSFSHYLGPPSNHSFFLTPTNEFEIIETVKSFSKNAAGVDDISPKLIKKIIHIIAKPLAHLYNLSFSEGTVPNCLKFAKVTPIYKPGATCNRTILNYRPISVLPSISKLVEKLVHKRLLNFFEMFDVLYSRQYGFRPKHSTLTALLDLTNELYNSADSNKYTIGVFLDLSKAFDTVNHDIMIQKLYHYGIRGVALQWFTSYLTDRKQCTIFNNTTSNWLPISCGVPHRLCPRPPSFSYLCKRHPQSRHQLIYDYVC